MTEAFPFLASALRECLPRLSSYEVWGWIAGCFFYLLHLLLFVLLRLCQRTSICRRLPLLQTGAWPRHGINRICCIVHSSVVLVWGCGVVLAEGALWRGPGEPPYFGGGVSELQRPLLLYSLSFFLYDVLYVIIEKDIPTTLHHVAALGGLLYAALHSGSGGEFVAGLCIGECSTPLLHLRYFARHYATLISKQKELETEKGQETQKRFSLRLPEGIFGVSFDKMNFAAESGFVCVFAVARGLANPCITLMTLLSPTTPLLVKAFAFSVCLISFFWLAQIVLLIRKKGTAARDRRQKAE